MNKLNKAMLLLVVSLVVILVVIHPTLASQPILNSVELLKLLREKIPSLEPVTTDVNYVDITGDGVLELLVGVNDFNTRKGHFLIYSYKNGKYINKLHYEWTYSFRSVAFEQVRFNDEQEMSPVAIITYSPAVGTGWLPINRDIIWWDGKGFRSIWSGLTDEVEAGTVDKEITNSFLRFYHDGDTVILEVVSVLRELSDESIPGEVKTTTTKRYYWNNKLLSFVEKKR